MAHAFSPIAAKPAFGNITQSDYASDYIQNKIAKLAYCSDVRNANCKKKFSQSELLLFNKGRLLNSYAFCVGTSLINEANLVAGLYTESDLSGVAVVCDVSGDACITPTAINSLSVPFYEHYLIDPDGELFGNTPCGMTNFTKYMSVPVVSILGPPIDLIAIAEIKSVLLSWTSPMTSDNSPITDYRIYWSTDNADEGGAVGWTIIDAKLVHSMYIVPGLVDGTTYYFKVEAVGLLGGGGKGTFSEVVSNTTLKVPEIPTDINVVETLNTTNDLTGQVLLSWIAPTSNGGSTITSYSIRYSNSGPPTIDSMGVILNWLSTTQKSSTTTSIALTGLSLSNTPYYFCVAAVNAVGTGAYVTTHKYLHKFNIDGPRTRQAINNYAAYIFSPTSSGSFISNLDIQINFLIVGGGTSGQFNNRGVTSSGGGSGGIIQGSLNLLANEKINIHVGSGGGRHSDTLMNSAVIQNNGYALGYSGMPSFISTLTCVIQSGYCDRGGFVSLPNSITGPSINIIKNIRALACPQGTGAAGPGAPGISGEMIHLYDNSVNIICSSSGGGGAGILNAASVKIANAASLSGGLPGSGAGKGGDVGQPGNDGVTYGSGGGGGGDISTQHYGLYGAGADGVVIIYFKYPIIDASINDTTIINTPTAPTGLTPTPGDTSVKLTWSAPLNNGGASITDYNIYYSNTSVNNLPWILFSHSPIIDLSINVTGLTNGTTYYFKITAVNSFGESYFSNMVSSAPSAPPLGSPISLQELSQDSTSILIRWSQPNNIINSTITDYIVQYSSDNKNTWTTFTHITHIVPQYNIPSYVNSGGYWDASINVTDLSSNTSYYFRVAAFIASSTISTYGYSTTPYMTDPDVPTDLSANNVGNNVYLTWYAPTRNENITYSVQYSDSDSNGSWITYNISDLTISGSTISGSIPMSLLGVNAVIPAIGKYYYFHVASKNSDGNIGQYSESYYLFVEIYYPFQ